MATSAYFHLIAPCRRRGRGIGPLDDRQPEPPKRELEVEKEEERIHEVIQGGDDDSDKGPMAVVPALAEACGAGVRF
jgi:hypothetical protein